MLSRCGERGLLPAPERLASMRRSRSLAARRISSAAPSMSACASVRAGAATAEAMMPCPLRCPFVGERRSCDRDTACAAKGGAPRCAAAAAHSPSAVCCIESARAPPPPNIIDCCCCCWDSSCCSMTLTSSGGNAESSSSSCISRTPARKMPGCSWTWAARRRVSEASASCWAWKEGGGGGTEAEERVTLEGWESG